MQLQLSFISFVFIKMNNKETIFKEYSINNIKFIANYYY